jgi:PAS domain S-box-containing protein
VNRHRHAPTARPAARRKPDAALRLDPQLLRSYIDHAGDAICVLDARDGRIRLCNRTACRQLGYTRRQLLALRATDIETQYAPAAVAHVSRQARKGVTTTWTRYGCHRRKDGSTFPVEIRLTVLPGTQPPLMLAVVRDITRRKRLEEELRTLNAELEEKVRERTSRLRAMAAEVTRVEHRERKRIASVLHEDLQQRLAATKYQAENLMRRLGSAASAGTAAQIARQLGDAIRLTRTLSNTLAPPVHHELGLRGSLEWLTRAMEQQYGLAVRLTGKGDFRLTSEEMHIFALNVLRELLLNVRKHAGVLSAEIRVRQAGERRVAIEVVDRGKGYRAIQSRRQTLGLFTIRERSLAMGADFRIASTPGRETRATLILPTA